MSVVGDNIRALRMLYGKGRHITQVELAKIAGVSRETVNKWETGAIGNVRASNINRIREYFGLSVDDLCSESSGLAARLRTEQNVEQSDGVPLDETTVNYVSLVTLCDLRGGLDSLRPKATIEVPSRIAASSHGLVAFVVEDDAMALILPRGSHAVLDLDSAPKTGSIVVVDIPRLLNSPIVRRIHCGTTKAMLSSESFRSVDDIVAPLSDVRVIGVVVWYQSAEML